MVFSIVFRPKDALRKLNVRMASPAGNCTDNIHRTIRVHVCCTLLVLPCLGGSGQDPPKQLPGRRLRSFRSTGTSFAEGASHSNFSVGTVSRTPNSMTSSYRFPRSLAARSAGERGFFYALLDQYCGIKPSRCPMKYSPSRCGSSTARMTTGRAWPLLTPRTWGKKRMLRTP